MGLVAGQSAIAAPTLAASPSKGTFTDTWDGRLTSTLCCTSTGTSGGTSTCVDPCVPASGGTSTGTSGGTSTGTSGGTSTGTSGGTSTGTSGGTSTGTSGGTSTCADPCVPSGPTLRLSKSRAAPGDTIVVAGDGYAQCTDDVSQITSVRLLEDRTPIAAVTGSGGSFAVQITVPPDTSAGNHTVAAECGIPSGILATSVLTVTEPSGGGSSSSGQGNSKSGRGSSSAGRGNSGAGQGSSKLGQGSSKSGQGGVSPGQSSTGKGAPIALISGTGGGLVLAILFVLWALTSHAGKGHRQARWVKEHVRAVAGSSLVPPTAQIHPRPGAPSVSLGLEPHDDHLGNQKIEEVAR
jgi:hypothetical protein